MYYRNLVVDAFKYAQQYVKLNYVTTNIRLSNSRGNMFTHRWPQSHVTIRSHCNNSHKFHKRKMKHFIASGGAFFGLFNFFKSEDDPPSELVMTIKRSILLIQKGEFNKAEQMLHIALSQAQTLQHYDGITYVYDVMANLAFDMQDYKKAETLFVSVLQRLLSKGTAKDDLKVVHISLKIAKIYADTGDIQKAEDGYKFCLENLQSHMAKNSEDEHVISLLGLTLEWYATMLFSRSRFIEALKHLSQAYELSAKVHGEEHEQTVILLNDLGTVNCMAGEYDKAIEYLSKAAEIGKNLPDMVDLGSVHVNLGNAFIKKGLYEEAKKCCNKGKFLARDRNNKDSLVEAEKCLNEIKQLMS